MDGGSVAFVLARATELRLDIMQTASSKQEDDADALLNIRDSLEALEAKLSSFQALQRVLWRYKEDCLAKVGYSLQKLLQNLKAYKGDDLEVIHEAIAFATSGVEMENNDLLLLLPPSPTRPTSLHFSVGTNTPQNETPNGSLHQSKPRSPLKGLRLIIGAAAKMLYPMVGFIAVLYLSGFELRLHRRGNDSKVLGMAQEQGNGEKEEKMIVCPPGKVLVVENGVSRCLVKERAEIPFKSVATVPDLRNWFGQGSLFN